MALLTITETCARLGVPPRRLKDWRLHGNGPTFHRLSHKTVAYDEDALDAWLRSRARHPSVQAQGKERREFIQEVR